MTEIQATVQQWLNEAGQAQGRAFPLDDKGCVVLEGADGTILILQVPPAGQHLHFNLQLGPIPSEDRENFLIHALILNLFQHETCGAALSLDPASNQLVLSCSRPASKLDSIEFSNMLQNLLETAGNLRTILFQKKDAVSGSSRQIEESVPAGALKA